MNLFFTKRFLCVMTLLTGFLYSQGQSDSSHLDNLSLKDLLNVKITTASKSWSAAGSYQDSWEVSVLIFKQ